MRRDTDEHGHETIDDWGHEDLTAVERAMASFRITPIPPEVYAARDRLLGEDHGVTRAEVFGMPARLFRERARVVVRAQLDAGTGIAGTSIPDILESMRTPEEPAAYDERERSMAERDAEREREK